MKYKMWIFVAVILGVTLILILPFSKNIDIEVKGIQCRIGDSEYFEEKTVWIRGIYKNYLIKEDVFEGQIEIEGYDFTSTGFIGEINHQSFPLVYTSNPPSNNTLGNVFYSTGFEKMLICISEPIESKSKEWTGEDGLYICFPAYTKDEALVLAGTYIPN